MKIAVLLSGSGVYDGSEIHESVLSLLALEENGLEYHCFAPNKKQYHVIDHTSGEEMDETRNCLIEAARIARGNISDIVELTSENFDALLIPGGFGAAKNLSTWAFDGPDGEINDEVKRVIQDFNRAGKYILALCMGPTLVAKAFENTSVRAQLTVGTDEEASPYDIAGIGAGMEKTGAVSLKKTVREIAIDVDNKIISAPCYMMEAGLLEVRNNIKQAVEALASALR